MKELKSLFYIILHDLRVRWSETAVNIGRSKGRTALPGPERSGNAVLIQHRISEFRQCPLSTNTVDGPVGNQWTRSASSVYTMLPLQSYRRTGRKGAVVRQCKASLKPVYNQCAISMSEIFK